MPPWLAIALALYAVASVVTFAVFAWDKRAAARSARRVPERALHALELLGGWPGALAAMWLLRHKNRKPAYWLVTALIVIAHGAAWALLLRAGALAA